MKLIKKALCTIALAVFCISASLSLYAYRFAYMDTISNKHVVKISTGRSTASGYYVKYRDETYLLTNRHVCRSVRQVIKFVRDPRTGGLKVKISLKVIEHETVKADGIDVFVLKISKEHDLCLLSSVRKDALSFGEAKLWEPVYVTGHPLGLSHQVIEGHISASDCSIIPWVTRNNCIKYNILDFSAGRGSSGSPVLNLFGDVVGMVFAGNHKNTLIIPVSHIKLFIDGYRID